MRSLLFHCKNYKVSISQLSNRPDKILPEKVRERNQSCNNCIVALITVEDKDSPDIVSKKIADEIFKMSQEVGHKMAVILPFAHLSKNLAESKITIQAFDLIERNLDGKIKILRGHFGSHKELMLDIYGHPGNARYREF